MHQITSHGKKVASKEVSEGTSKEVGETGTLSDAYEHAVLPILMQQGSEEANSVAEADCIERGGGGRGQMHADPGEDPTVEPLPRRVTRSIAQQRESDSGSTRKQRLKDRVRAALEELKQTCATETSEDHADPLLQTLTQYHDRLYSEAHNILTEEVTTEVLDVVTDPSKIDSENREYRWSKNDEEKLNILNAQARNLQTPKKWTWAAKEGTTQYTYNHERMEYLVEHELQTVLKHCQKCNTTGLLVGIDQVNSAYCIDCVAE